MSAQPERMGTESVPRLILTFAIPSIAGMIANALYNIMDRIFVGNTVGPDGLGAISVCFPFMMLTFSLCLLFGVGAAPLISMALGENDRGRAELVLANTAVMVLLSSTVLAVISGFFTEEILRLSNIGPGLMPLAKSYMSVILFGVPFSMLSFTLNFCLRAEGHPSFAMCTQILGAFSNIVLDAVFIIGLKKGVAGAAWGTILSQMLTAAWVLSFYIRKVGVLRFRARNCVPRMAVQMKIIPLGIAPCLTELSFTIFMVLFNRTLQQYGGDLAISAFGAFMGWDSLLFLPVIGISEAVQTIFAYNYGAKLYHRVLSALKWALAMADSYFAFSALAVYFFAEPMMMTFSQDAELLAIGVPGARVSYAGVFFVGIAIIVTSFFQGLGRAKLCLVLSVCRQIVFLLPTIFILPRIFGLLGVWYCFPVVDVCGGILAMALLSREYRRLAFNELEMEGVKQV